MSKVVVFVPNWVGDAVMATPTLRALHKRYGDGIVGVMNPTIAEVLRGCPYLTDIWPYDRGCSTARAQLMALVPRLRRANVTVSVHLTNDFPSVLMARLGGVRQTTGYARNRRGWMLTHALQPLRHGRTYLPVSALDYYLEIAYALGCTAELPRMELAVSHADERAADAAWRTFGLTTNDDVVLLNSSGAYGAAKLWPDEHFASLAARIVTELDRPVVVMCGPAERERAVRIAALASCPRVFTLAQHDVSIGLSKACVKRAACLVSTDSGPRHFGAAFGTPVVALFGPTHQAWSDTHYPGEIRLQIPVDCGPCSQRECPERHHRCMQDLSVAMAFDAVQRALAPTPAPA